jgi:predicted Zn-dependent protease
MDRVGGESGRPSEFLSTHPNPDTRIIQLEGWMGQALQYYQNRNLPLPVGR